MRIGVTGLRGIPNVMGGIESHCEELYPRLRRLRPADDFVVVARSPYMEAAPPPYEGVAVVPVFTIRSKYFETIVHTFLALLVMRTRLGAGVAHIHGIGPAVMAPFARLLGLRLVVTHHGEDFKRAKWNALGKAVLRLGEWCAVHAADALIVVSDQLTEELRRRYPRRADRISHIPNGATRIAAGSAARADPQAVLGALGIEPGRYVLAVGRLVPEKAFDQLVDGFLRSGIAGKLVIAGKADHQDAYARALVERASDRVVFAGFQPHESLRTLYENCSLFVLPSHHEGLPIAALEAAAMGCPMLLSDIAANREIGLSAMSYFPVGDVDALAVGLRRDHGDFAIDRDRILRRFDWNAIAELTNRVYDRVIG